MKDKETTQYKNKKNIGQFFTQSELVEYLFKVLKLNLNNNIILEPSCGNGVFVKYILNNFSSKKIICCDIDKKALCNLKKNIKNNKICELKNINFFDIENEKKYDFIVGNPPFNLKTINYYNTTEGFLLKSLELLKENGSLLMILPNTILRNKCYESLRKKIIDEFKIEAIIDTRNFSFEGADVETIAILIKNEKVKKQEYRVVCDKFDKNVLYFNNPRYTINIEEVFIQELKNTCTISDIFKIYRGKSFDIVNVKGRDIDYYKDSLIGNISLKNNIIALQNIAYRLVSNVVDKNKKFNDTITILEPKIDLSYKKLRYIANYLNSSLSYILLHTQVLNYSKLTTHIDKYYIKDLKIPDVRNIDDIEINKLLKSIDNSNNPSDILTIRNNYFYNYFCLKKNVVEKINKNWDIPLYKKKRHKK